MHEPRDIRLRRLWMRSIRRGIKEMDIVLSRYAGTHLAQMSDAQIDCYERLLEENDQDLLQWVTGQSTAPEPLRLLIDDIRRSAETAARTP